MILNHFIHQFEGKQKEIVELEKEVKEDLAIILFFSQSVSETYSAVEGIVLFLIF